MFDVSLGQGSLFGTGSVDFDNSFAAMRRIDLGEGAWLDYAPMWMSGHEILYARLAEGAPWSQPTVHMYERNVVTPRLVARIDPAMHEALPALVDALSLRYGVRLDRLSAGWYRTGNDSVAPHGDRIARDRDSATVATISLGGARRFLIRSKSGGPSRRFSLGHGDLAVMGGTCQRTHVHGVPKTAADAAPRISLMFRHRYD